MADQNIDNNSNQQPASIVGVVVGIVLSVLGLVGIIVTAATIIGDRSGFFRYTYAPPFSDHEVMVIAGGVISVILLIVGAVVVTIGLLRKKR